MSEFQQVVKEGAQKVKRTAKRVLIGLLALAFIGSLGYVWVSNWSYSEGTRAGVLIKVSRKGVIWKTYEGQLNLGGFSVDEQSGLEGNIWSFSVPKGEVYRQLENNEGQRVKLRYRQVYNPMPWQGKTDYFVYEVTPVNESGK